MNHPSKQSKGAKSISIHGLDEETMKLLSERAKSAGTSVNKVVKELLSRALGTGKDKKDRREEFLDLFGAWTESDEQAIRGIGQRPRSRPPGDWK